MARLAMQAALLAVTSLFGTASFTLRGQNKQSSLDIQVAGPAHFNGTNGPLAIRSFHSIETRNTAKVRVCNAVTTNPESLIHFFLNGKEITKIPLKARHCQEFSVPISESNAFEIKKSGKVNAEWTETYSDKKLSQLASLFLVAHLFDSWPNSIFMVNEFPAEDDGEGSAQVAYMDVYQGAEDAILGLSANCANFQMLHSTVVTGVCGDDYTAHVIGQDNVERDAGKIAIVDGEQYLVLRVAPEGTAHYEEGKDNVGHVMVFPK